MYIKTQTYICILYKETDIFKDTDLFLYIDTHKFIDLCVSLA